MMLGRTTYHIITIDSFDTNGYVFRNFGFTSLFEKITGYRRAQYKVRERLDSGLLTIT